MHIKIKISIPGQSGHSASLGIRSGPTVRGAACPTGDRKSPGLQNLAGAGAPTCVVRDAPTIELS